MVRKRLVSAILVLALLALMAGCLSMIFGGISDETLDANESYDDLLDRDADVVIDVDGGEYRAVFNLSETEEISMYQSTFYREEALDIEAVRFWYPNGTMVTGSQIYVDQGRSSTDVRFPNENGTFAYRASAGSRSLSVQAYTDGSYEVTLPSGYGTTNFLFGRVSPSGYDRNMVGDRERLFWDENDDDIAIRFYRTWHIPAFLGAVGVILIIGGGGIYHLYRKIQRLREQREELGLDIDIDDDSERRPPPGMG